MKTAHTAGYKGAGGDLDQDGIIGAFDIDDNGNRILDNVDRSGRGAGRPGARSSAALAATARTSVPRAGAGGPPPLTPPGSVSVFTNFWPQGPTINANIGTIGDLDALIADNMASALALVIEGPESTTVGLLDGLGNTYIATHEVDGAMYPQVGVEYEAPTYTPSGLLNLVPDPRHPRGCPIMPGALPAEIAAGDCFVMTAENGARYPGTLNFVFTTTPALVSYRFDGQATATAISYGADGIPEGGLRFIVPAGADKVTLTFWRPQRRAGPGETGNASGWVDMGKLWYEVGLRDAADMTNAISKVTANGDLIPASQYSGDFAQYTGGFIDPAADLPADPAHTLSFTLDFARAFGSTWNTFSSGKDLPLDLQSSCGYGDNAMTTLWFRLE